MATTHVEIVAPERNLFSGEAEMVVCRAADGDIAFLADHMPFLGALEAGDIRVDTEGGEQLHFPVTGGFVQVHDNRVIMLVVEGAEGAPAPDEDAATPEPTG
ncbi:MAG TPA: F0F1 ATP synthase subunit epsilon [Acidimicrobiales bacterium]|nr:F0F1 ATP synthase subunit epsilon [Acidimicrobiales bacterium]